MPGVVTLVGNLFPDGDCARECRGSRGRAGHLGVRPVIIAHTETNRLLARDNDPGRPLATVTSDREYRLSVGSQLLELSYQGIGEVMTR